MAETETTLDAGPVETLAQRFGGELLHPHDGGYDDARKVYNGMIDRRPSLVARCTGPADVLAAIEYAAEQALPVAVRCGGHSIAGAAVCDEGLMLDLSRMTGVRIGAANRTARANGGVVWAEYDRETQALGLASPGGRVTTTGLGGFTLGGGYGWLSPKYGLACDNLVSADVVTADARLLTASTTESEDLYWGLRGGGGNFGVVTSFEFRVHPVGPTVLGGLLVYPLETGVEVLSVYRDVLAGAPDELATAAALFNAPPEPFIPERLHGRPVLGIGVCYCGDPMEGETLLRPLKDSRPLADLVGPMPYRSVQAMLDSFAPHGWRNYSRGEYLPELSDAAIETFLRFAPEGLSPMTMLIVFQHGGAVSRVDDEVMAFSHREAAFLAHPIACWTDPAQDDRHIGWARAFSEAMEPFKTPGVYLNFTAEEGDDRVQSGYAADKLGRLVALKQKYDPTNMFRFNHNIRPTVVAPPA
jgi:FAD/FMN-containing dehydrogenase